MGGAAAALARAREDFARGEYRFVAEAMSHLVFADPANPRRARLGADALEQLGYQAESATWRNAYLLGALELRQGGPNPAARAPVSPDLVRAMSLDLFFDYLAVRLDADRAEGKRLIVNWVLTDTGERYALDSGALRADLPAGRQRPDADATVTLDRPVLNRLVLRELTFADAVAAGPGGGRRRRGQGRRALRPPRRLHADVRGGGAAAGGLTRRAAAPAPSSRTRRRGRAGPARSRSPSSIRSGSAM